MSISQELRRAGPYISDGSTKAFTFSFKVMKRSDLSVVVADNKDTSVSETLASTNYTVTLNDNQENSPGGTVTLNNALPSGKALAILSNAPFLQEKVFTNAGGFYPEVLNNALDTLTIYCQQLKEALGRCLIVPSTSEHTPQEVLAEVLEIASTANDYAQQAQAIYDTVKGDVAEIKALKAEIDDLVKTFSDIEALVQSAQVAAASAEQDAADAQEILQKVREAAEQAGFSMRSHSYLTANATVSLTSILPSVNVKAGDLILSRSDGNVFSVMSVTSTTATVGTVIANLRGPRGLQGNDGATGSQGAPGLQGSAGATFTPAVSTEGVLSWTNDRGLPNPTPVNIKGAKGDKGEPGEQGSPGPVGSTGPQGPMGSSPWAAAFGQFRIEDSYLKMDYVGVQPATNFTINSNGELEATV